MHSLELSITRVKSTPVYQQLSTKHYVLKLDSTNFNRFCTRIEPYEARRGDGQNDINLIIGRHGVNNSSSKTVGCWSLEKERLVRIGRIRV